MREAFVERDELNLKNSPELRRLSKIWKFSQNRYGKPYLLGKFGRNIEFNISHTDGMIGWLFAISSTGSPPPVGLDLEYTRRRVNCSLLAKHHFSEGERLAIDSMESEERKRELFFTYWTLKEAVLKAVGIGLQVQLSSFSFHHFAPPVDEEYLSEVKFSFGGFDIGEFSSSEEEFTFFPIPVRESSPVVFSFSLGDWVGALALFYRREGRGVGFNLKKIKVHF